MFQLNFRYRELKLATDLIKLGADVNLQVRPRDMQFPSEEGVPSLYFATNVGDAEIVKLLLNSGRARFFPFFFVLHINEIKERNNSF